MRSIGIFLSLFFFLGNVGASPTHEKGPFFWKAEKEGAISYIFGTFLYMDFKNSRCYDEISNHLKNADIVFTTNFFNFEAEDQVAKRSKELSDSKKWQSFESLNQPHQEFLRSRYENLFKYEAFPPPLESMSYTEMGRLLKSTCFFEKQDILIKDDDILLHEIRRRGPLMELSIRERATDRVADLGYIEPETAVEVFEFIQTSAEDLQESIENYDLFCESAVKDYMNLDILFKEAIIKYYYGELQKEEIIHLSKAIHAFTEGNLLSPSARERNFQFVHQRTTVNQGKKYLKQIIQALEDHSQIFVATQVSHFVANLDILEGLREEGFSVTQIGGDCRFSK